MKTILHIQEQNLDSNWTIERKKKVRKKDSDVFCQNTTRATAVHSTAVNTYKLPSIVWKKTIHAEERTY